MTYHWYIIIFLVYWLALWLFVVFLDHENAGDLFISRRKIITLFLLTPILPVAVLPFIIRDLYREYGPDPAMEKEDL